MCGLWYPQELRLLPRHPDTAFSRSCLPKSWGYLSVSWQLPHAFKMSTLIELPAYAQTPDRKLRKPPLMKIELMDWFCRLRHTQVSPVLWSVYITALRRFSRSKVYHLKRLTSFCLLSRDATKLGPYLANSKTLIAKLPSKKHKRPHSPGRLHLHWSCLDGI
jgi:hypothetical protein